MIIGRSKTQEEIGYKIDVSAKEFQKLESLEEIYEEDNQFYEVEGGCSSGGEKLDRPHSEMLEEDDAERAELPKRIEWGRQNP